MMRSMVRRPWRVGTVVMTLLVAAAACRQLVGIGDAPPTEASEAGPACGVSYAGSKCQACLEQHCCGNAQACATDMACNALEACLGSCAPGNEGCRATCSRAHLLGPNEPEDRLAACLAFNCSTYCGLACGGVAANFEPPADASCQTCIFNSVCPQATACADDPECLAYWRCALTNYLPDREQACEAQHEAGADAYAAFTSGLQAPCGETCGIGTRWDCIGHTGPYMSSSPTTATLHLSNAAARTPLVGATVDLCLPTDPGCDAGVFAGTSDDAGVAVIHVPAPVGSPAYGPTGYLQITQPAVLPELIFWDFPLSESSFSAPVVLFTPAQGAGLELDLNGKVDMNLGAVVAYVFDCTGAQAPGVNFAVTDPPGSSPIVLYWQGGMPSPGATTTDGQGFAVLFNVPIGEVTLTATPSTLGRASSQVSVVTRQSWVTQAAFNPNK